MNVIFMLLTAASAGGQCSGCSAPAVVHSGAPIVSASSCGDCGSTCSACEAAPQQPSRGGLFGWCKKKKQPAPEPCQTCDTCNTCSAPAAAPVSTCSTDCACGSVASTCCEAAPPQQQSRGGLFGWCKKKKQPAPVADCGCAAPSTCGCGSGAPTVIGAPIHGAPAIYGHGHNAGIISNPGAAVTTIPGTGSPVISTPGSGEPVKAMPKPADKPTEVKPEVKKGAMLDQPSNIAPAGAKIESESKNPFELDRRYEKRVSHDAEYNKVTGQLFFVHTDGGIWVLRFAPLSEEDRYGGSLVLARDSMMNSYKDGDLVSVAGQIIGQKGSPRLGGPLYRIQSISLVDRPVQ